MSALLCCRVLGRDYPEPLKITEFVYQITGQMSLDQQKEGGEFHLLTKVAFEWNRLKTGESILTGLVQFYRFLHSQLAHTLTYEEMQTTTIGDVICKHPALHDLYDKVKGKTTFTSPFSIFYYNCSFQLVITVILIYLKETKH